MRCKHHPTREARYFCASCRAPLCEDCAEEVRPGVFNCFQCGMLQSVSQVGSSLEKKREKARGKETKKRRKWGPFQYFLVISSVLILTMWGVILFGGHPAPEGSAEFSKEGRVLLFMVDGALRRYAHYEAGIYPAKLSDLVPKYLALKKTELFHLEKLSYERSPEVGYRLSLVDLKPGEMKIIISPKGIEHASSGIGGAR